MDDLKPGRELDALVAEKVMGWRRCHLHKHEPVAFHFEGQAPVSTGRECDFFPISLAHDSIGEYSTDIAAAWEVVERLQTQFSVRVFKGLSEGTWEVRLGERGALPPIYAMGDTAPHAICLAALKAVSPSPQTDRTRPEPCPPDPERP